MIADVDMCGAYASAMAALPAIDWTGGATSTKAVATLHKAVDRGAYVFAHVGYKFPNKVAHLQTTLCEKLQVSGPTYALAGECYATGPELADAWAMGATITQVHAAMWYEVVPGEYPFADYLASVGERRVAAKAAGDKAGDLMAKLVGNGLYGKLGQGLADKKSSRVTEEDKRQDIRYSSVTSPQYAAYCTAHVRCALAALVNECVGVGGKPLAGTTDGAMMLLSGGQAQYEQLVKAYEATRAGAYMADGRRRLGQVGTLEIKFQGTTALTCRTRTNALWDANGAVTAGAWTGWRGIDGANPTARARDMAWAWGRRSGLWWRERHGKGNLAHWGEWQYEDDHDSGAYRQEQTPLPSPYVVYTGGREYRPIPKTKTLRVDPDHKRRVALDGTTTTWPTVADFIETRNLAQQLHKHDHSASAVHLAQWPKAVPKARPKVVTAAMVRARLSKAAKLLPLEPTHEALERVQALVAAGALPPDYQRDRVWGTWRRVLGHLLRAERLAGLTVAEAAEVVGLYAGPAAPGAVALGRVLAAEAPGWGVAPRRNAEGKVVRVIARVAPET